MIILYVKSIEDHHFGKKQRNPQNFRSKKIVNGASLEIDAQFVWVLSLKDLKYLDNTKKHKCSKDITLILKTFW